jgi:hypothetical protein
MQRGWVGIFRDGWDAEMLQGLWNAVARHFYNFPNYHRELLVAADGGTVAIDWFRHCDMNQSLPSDTPILIVFHGLTGEPPYSLPRVTRNLGIFVCFIVVLGIVLECWQKRCSFYQFGVEGYNWVARGLLFDRLFGVCIVSSAITKRMGKVNGNLYLQRMGKGHPRLWTSEASHERCVVLV